MKSLHQKYFQHLLFEKRFVYLAPPGEGPKESKNTETGSAEKTDNLTSPEQNKKDTLDQGKDAVKGAKDKVDVLEQQERNLEKEAKAKAMAETKLDDAVKHFKAHQEKQSDLTKESLKQIGKDFIHGLVQDPNFPGLEYLYNAAMLESKLSHKFPGDNFNTVLDLNIVKAKKDRVDGYAAVVKTKQEGTC